MAMGITIAAQKSGAGKALPGGAVGYRPAAWLRPPAWLRDRQETNTQAVRQNTSARLDQGGKSDSFIAGRSFSPSGATVAAGQAGFAEAAAHGTAAAGPYAQSDAIKEQIR
ncbi:MAG: hypothetical protein ACREFY_19710 [Acetobacteraceae bacterium]